MMDPGSAQVAHAGERSTVATLAGTRSLPQAVAASHTARDGGPGVGRGLGLSSVQDRRVSAAGSVRVMKFAPKRARTGSDDEDE